MEMIFIEVALLLTIWFLPAFSVYFICKYLNNIPADRVFYMSDFDRSLFNAASIVPVINIIVSILLFFVLAMAFSTSAGKK